jgi:hypothetical protein
MVLTGPSRTNTAVKSRCSRGLIVQCPASTPCDFPKMPASKPSCKEPRREGVKRVRRETRRCAASRVHLQIKGRGFDSFVFVTGKFGEAIDKGISDPKLYQPEMLSSLYCPSDRSPLIVIRPLLVCRTDARCRCAGFCQ